MTTLLSEWWRRNARFLWVLALLLALSAAFDRWQWERSLPTVPNMLAWHRTLDHSPANHPILEIAHAIDPQHPEVRERLARAYEGMGWPEKARRFGGGSR